MRGLKFGIGLLVVLVLVDIVLSFPRRRPIVEANVYLARTPEFSQWLVFASIDEKYAWDRWFTTEFVESENKIVVAAYVSYSPFKLGTWASDGAVELRPLMVRDRVWNVYVRSIEGLKFIGKVGPRESS